MTPEATASELRKTGISAIGDVRWGTHFCYFYETKQDLLDTLVLYFKAGLEHNEFCLWVVSLATSPGDQIFDVAHIHQVAVARRNVCLTFLGTKARASSGLESG
jgi:hypothetical protein